MVNTGFALKSAEPLLGAKEGVALVIAHPGHELRVHAWLERFRPQVFVLTDGSGGTGRSRVSSTAEVLERAGASEGSIFGRLRDRDAYKLILDGDVSSVKALILELVEPLVEAKIQVLASDAVEGFNPVHDLCFLVAEAAVEIASRRLGYRIRHYDFLLEDAPEGAKPNSIDVEQVLRYELDEANWERKIEAAWAYGLLRSEIERAFGSHGRDAFRVEVLRRKEAMLSWPLQFHPTPWYETFGEERVETGVYDQVLRFQEHFLPLAESVQAWSLTA